MREIDLAKISTADIRQRHRRIDSRVCNARSVGPITVKHSNGRWDPRILRCTERIPEGLEHHEGNHHDGACCWQSHEFLPAQAHPEWVDHRQLQVLHLQPGLAVRHSQAAGPDRIRRMK